MRFIWSRWEPCTPPTRRSCRPATEARALRAPGGRAVSGLGDDGWFALGGPPALTNADIERARADGRPDDQGAGRRAPADPRRDSGVRRADARTRAPRRGGRDTPRAGSRPPSISPSWSTTGSCPCPTSTSGRRRTASAAPRACRIAGGLSPETARQLAALLERGAARGPARARRLGAVGEHPVDDAPVDLGAAASPWSRVPASVISAFHSAQPRPRAQVAGSTPSAARKASRLAPDRGSRR